MRILATLALPEHGDPTEADHAIANILEPLGGRWIGRGTFLPTLQRDWEYELPACNAATALTRLRAAGFGVDFDAEEGGRQ
jgi:hypothetical protein